MAASPAESSAQVKRRDKKDEGRGNSQDSDPPTQAVIFEDGKCSCCPYGYHIDLDFLNFCKTISNGSALSNLKRIQRTKRKLRKSMELMLQHQNGSDSASSSPAPNLPPDVVHSTEASRLIHMVNYEESATHQVLRDIDSSVNATLASIDSMQRTKGPSHSLRYMSSDSEDGYMYSPLSPESASSLSSQHFDCEQPPAPPPRRSSLRYAHSNGDEGVTVRKDSMSSVSSVSTVSSEQVHSGHSVGYTPSVHSFESSMVRPVESRPRAMTSESLSAVMSTHLSHRHDGEETPSSPMSPDTTISKASLAAMKEAMAESLQRIRDLEEQVKAIPIMQVRISVLKEEKRLLALQLKAKSGNVSTCTVGVGEDTVDSPRFSSSRSFSHSPSSPYSSSSPVFPLKSPTAKTPPPTLPKPSRFKTVGVGDHSMVEPYLLQPALPTGFTVTDNQVENEIQRKTRQTLHTSPAERKDPNSGSPTQSPVTVNHIQQYIPHTPTRSIGVGDGDINTPVHIHSTELRTVIIGADTSNVSKRNVGVEVRVPTRSVGVAFSSEEARPSTRTIGVNVKSDTAENVKLDVKGELELRNALQNVLQRNVRTVGTNCKFQPAVVEVGIQHEPMNGGEEGGVDSTSPLDRKESVRLVSVGCGAENGGADSLLPPPVSQESVGLMVKPDTCESVVDADRDWLRDVGVDAITLHTSDKGMETDSVCTGMVMTNTEHILHGEFASQTDCGVFEAMAMIKSCGSNTTTVHVTSTHSNTTTPTTTHTAINTDHAARPEPPPKEYCDSGMNTDPKAVKPQPKEFCDSSVNTDNAVKPEPKEFCDSSVNTDNAVKSEPKEFCDSGVNTPTVERRLSLSRVECVDVSGEEVQAAPKRPLTMQEQIIQRGASQAFAFLGSTSSSGSPTSPKGLLTGLDFKVDTSTETVKSSSTSSDLMFNSPADQNGDVGANDCFDPSDREMDMENMVEEATACLQTLSELEQSRPQAEHVEEESASDEQDKTASASDSSENASRQQEFSETVITKRQVSGSRLSRHRYSDGARVPQELDLSRQGIYSGHRVGSVEDFMPDEMRKLMNLETVESGNKAQSGADSKTSHSVRTVSKSVTTKQISHDSVSKVSVTVTSPEGLEINTEEEEDEGEEEEEETYQEGNRIGILSKGQFDLSQIAEMADSSADDNAEDGSSAECSESEGIKDSGYDDSALVNPLGESSSLQGLDSSTGSLEHKELKSIMKKSKSDSAIPKRGISFADSVVGGTGSSSEEEGSESDDESTTSYDEGSYDSREGDITYECQDDEAIAQGLPGAQMYDQNIRETYELSDDMRKACEVLANYLVDSTTIQTKELNSNQCVVQEEWFRVSSHKLSSVHQVEDYLSSINEISHRLLEYIVNLVDNNGNSAIHYCVSHCNFDIVSLLLDTEVCDVKRANKAGYTPTMLASLAFIQNDDHRDIIRQLFLAGDINAYAEKTGQTALMLATSQCRTDMVELLLETGADCNQQDFDGSTALMCACEHGHTAIVQLLLAQPNCDATLTDNENSTALSIAMEASHKDIGVILYKHLNFSSPDPDSLEASATSTEMSAVPSPAVTESPPEASHPLTPATLQPADRESTPETEV